ncbi:metaxin 1 [Turnera subulata]|uniref:Metaxin 1 n=1 Tax=Turnera subulata TaxID=218843 RepID=A0A9Q0J2Z0_9ROSI|nr:metaxin 1 [Turnera subulata]
MEEGRQQQEDYYTLVARKPCFGLPTGCPTCLPVYIYLKFASLPFLLDFNSKFPDSDQIPYFESGATYVAYNNEDGGVIERLRKDGIVDLDSEFCSVPEWVAMKAMVGSWLGDALSYELWVGSDGSSARKIYYSDLPWLIGKALSVKQVFDVKQRLGITKENTDQREKEIYERAKIAYGALSTALGDQAFLFGDRPSSLDACFLGNVLVTLEALPETSVLRATLLEHSNVIRYAEKLKAEILEASSSSSFLPSHSRTASSIPKSRPSSSSSHPKRKQKREKTEEEKKFARRAKYFVVAQVVAVLVFLSVMGGYDFSEDADADQEGYGYD